jgi:uncharacterized OsmC-like protein
VDAEELRALQAPLKRNYRESAESALIPARAEGVLDGEDIACRIVARGGETVAGLHMAAGGTGALACSADMLLEALVACAGVTLRAVATAMSIPLRGGRIVAEGTWDARGTLGIDKAAPVGLTQIALHFELDTDADPAQVERLIATTERFCVIAQTLRSPPRLTITHAADTRAMAAT